MRPFLLHDALLDLFFPRRRCIACGGAKDVRDGLCAACVSQFLPPPEPFCPICGEMVFEPGLCKRCKLAHPSYAAARVAVRYQGAARSLLLAMKFHGEFDLPTRHFARRLLAVLQREGWAVDAVVSVPAARHTLRRRGYNQAERLARRLAGEAGLPFLPSVLCKKRGMRSQVGLGAAQRFANLQNAVSPGPRIRQVVGKTVLLVDDIMTTGSTVESCAHALRAAGARAVYVLCAARRFRHARPQKAETPDPDDLPEAQK